MNYFVDPIEADYHHSSCLYRLNTATKGY